VKNLLRLTTIALSAVLFTACADENSPDMTGVLRPVPPPQAHKSTVTSQSEFFGLHKSDIEFEQSKALSNETTVLAQVARSGTSLGELKKSDFVLMENGKEVKDFTLSLEDTKSEQVVDIAFVVDVTRSMGPFIEAAKARLTNFVNQSRAKGYHTRMCISTFGDYVVQKCERFYDNDPKDDKTLSQTEELISELAKMHAATGGPNDPDPLNRDPGNDDVPENPMGALIDVAGAPWRPDAQKFVILVTDAAFLYSPDNQGVIGANAPSMQQVNQAIEASQVVVMAVTPSVPGYNSTFQDQPDIVAKSNGEHFLFRDVINKRVSLDDILDRIMSRVNATYKLTYKVDESTNTNLDPSLRMDQRQITVQFKNPENGTIEDVKASSSFPDGRPRYTTEWTLSDKAVSSEEIEVTVAGNRAAVGDYQIVNNVIKFSKVPAASAKIHVKFYYADAFSNLRLKPISLSEEVKEANLKITLNNITARPQDYKIERDLNGNVSITLLPSVAANDYYNIKASRGLAFRVE